MISHKYKFIYISPPRNGNSSLLSRFSDNDVLSNKINSSNLQQINTYCCKRNNIISNYEKKEKK